MKKVQNVIIFLALVCAPIRCVALDYTPYSGVSEAPTMPMRSTSVWAGQRSDVRTEGAQYSGGFYTSASAVTGGVTTIDNYNPAQDGYVISGPRRNPGFPNVIPAALDDGWDVWLFMAVLCTGYVAYKKRTSTI